MTRRSGTESFLRLWSAWKRLAPAGVARADPGRVIRLLERSGREGGIFQSELLAEVEMNQPALSKLTEKLVQAGFILRQAAKQDGRMCRICTTTSGRAFLANLDRALSAAIATKPSGAGPGRRWRKIQPAAGQQDFDMPLP